MNKRLASILVFVLILILIGAILRPPREGVVKVTKEGYAHYFITIKGSNDTYWMNATMYAETVLNNGEGYLNINVTLKGIFLESCGNVTVAQMFLSLNVKGKMPDKQVPKDLVFAVRGLNNSQMFYTYSTKNDTQSNLTPWPEYDLNSQEAWSPKSIYKGYKPNASSFSGTTHLLCRIKFPVQNMQSIVQIAARIYGLGDMFDSVIDLTVLYR